MSHVAVPSEYRLAQATAAPVNANQARRIGSFARALVGTCLLVGLSAFNAWWYWRDARALPDANTISDWMRREQYPRAESALWEQLRRSPHDGETRMMLARTLASAMGRA